MIVLRAALPLLLAAVLAAPAAEAQNRRETIAGWRLEAGGTGDGGHMVRLTRRSRVYHYEHYLEFWRGNGGVVIADSFRRGRCSSGDASAIVPYEQGMGRETFDQRLADYLRECPLRPADEALLRRTLDAVWPRFSAWAEEALAAIEAENRAIAEHGRRD
jgi:hypothetical protein